MSSGRQGMRPGESSGWKKAERGKGVKHRDGPVSQSPPMLFSGGEGWEGDARTAGDREIDMKMDHATHARRFGGSLMKGKNFSLFGLLMGFAKPGLQNHVRHRGGVSRAVTMGRECLQAGTVSVPRGRNTKDALAPYPPFAKDGVFAGRGFDFSTSSAQPDSHDHLRGGGTGLQFDIRAREAETAACAWLLGEKTWFTRGMEASQCLWSRFLEMKSAGWGVRHCPRGQDTRTDGHAG